MEKEWLEKCEAEYQAVKQTGNYYHYQVLLNICWALLETVVILYIVSGAFKRCCLCLNSLFLMGVRVMHSVLKNFFLKAYTQNHKKWPLTEFGSDFGQVRNVCFPEIVGLLRRENRKRRTFQCRTFR